jgi:hypothetical protein
MEKSEHLHKARNETLEEFAARNAFTKKFNNQLKLYKFNIFSYNMGITDTTCQSEA